MTTFDYKNAITVRDIMQTFLDRTGLTSQMKDHSERRYLWTDAFAIFNLFQLAQQEHQEEARLLQDIAVNLIESVHMTLGKFRMDDEERCGHWLPGASDRFPTAGGLRIGKQENERLSDEPYDCHSEWDKDGQYFHYLTKWMLALDLATRNTGDVEYVLWALQLMKTAFERFVHKDYGRSQMYWKMSIDLTRPQMLSQGVNDPLEGYIVLCRLLSTADLYNVHVPDLPTFFEAKGIFLSMIRISPVNDPLELGGMLLHIHQLELLQETEGPDYHQERLLCELHPASMESLEYLAQSNMLQSQDRIGFRELGLAIGLQAIERLESKGRAQSSLKSYCSMVHDIHTYWLNPINQKASISWTKHLDLSEVMLATSLDPGGCLWSK